MKKMKRKKREDGEKEVECASLGKKGGRLSGVPAILELVWIDPHRKTPDVFNNYKIWTCRTSYILYLFYLINFSAFFLY